MPARLRSSFWQQYIGTDRRSLALMRVTAALVILGDLFVRVSHLSAHYGIGSVYPPEVMYPSSYLSSWSFLGDVIRAFPHFPLLIFVVAFVSAAFLLVGYKTRLATPIVWLAMLTIQNMDPLVNHGGDTFLRLLLLLGIFLPWGDYFSVDRALKFDTKISKRVVSFWTLALLIQISLIYLAAGLEKTAGLPWQNGSAVYLALSSYYATHFGSFLLHFHGLLTFLTYAVRIFQLSVVFLVFFPVANAVTRTIAMVLLMFMHVIFDMCLNLGTFSWIAVALLSSLTPSQWWDYTVRTCTARFGPVAIYYDGDCGFCKKSSYLLRTFFLLPSATIAIAQSDSSIYADMRKHDSWVVVNQKGERAFTYAAGVELLSHSPLFFFLVPLMRLPWARYVGERVYRWIANHRSRVCKPARGGILLPRLASTFLTVLSGALGIVFIISIVLWNYGNFYRMVFPSLFLDMGRTLGFAQRWTLFAPNTVSYTGWNVVEGTLADGEHVNVFDSSQPLYKTRPPYMYPLYGSDVRWLKYFETVDRAANEMYRPYLGTYFCTSWNATHRGAEALLHVDVTFTYIPTRADYQPGIATSSVIVSRDCAAP